MSSPDPPAPPAPPAPVDDHAPPSALLPGNFPFPAALHGAPPPPLAVHAVAAGPSPPPPTYPALARGLKPFVDCAPNSDEAEELRTARLMRTFWRRSAYYFGERDDAYEARARAGDVSRFGDVARNRGESDDDDDDESGDDDEGEGNDDKKTGAVINARWVRRMSTSFTLGDFKITDERWMPRELVEAAFGDAEDASGGVGGGRKRPAAALPIDAVERARKKGKGATRGLSRLERLARLETRAASGREASVGGGKSVASRTRRGAAGIEDEGSDGDDDDGAGAGADDDDELDSDDDYGKAVDFDDDDDVVDVDVGGDEAFY